MGSMTQRSLQLQRDCLHSGSSKPCGAIAQLGERLNGIQEVSGSITALTPESRSRFSGFFILVALSLPIVMACPNVADEDGTIPSHNTTQNDAGTLSIDDSGATDPGIHF